MALYYPYGYFVGSTELGISDVAECIRLTQQVAGNL